MDTILYFFVITIQITAVTVVVCGVSIIARMIIKNLRERKEQEIADYLTIQARDDERFIKAYASLINRLGNSEYITGQIKQDLLRLNERINRRRKEDCEKIVRFPPDVNRAISGLHPAWLQIQEHIAEILNKKSPR